MKLAFSTIGCPDWSFSEIFVTAKDLHFDGIEVRGIGKEMYAPKVRRFDADHIEGTKEKLKDADIAISMLTSGAVLGGEMDAEDAVKEATDYIDLAAQLSCKYIRVLVSSEPHVTPANMEMTARLYSEICEYGEKHGVTPLIETNGILADSKKMKEFIEGIESQNKGVLWDIHHPYRFFGETPEDTYAQIGPYIKYLHLKDSRMDGDKVQYRMMGYGDVPIYDTLQFLKEKGYDGYLTLEWVKRWNPDMEEPGVVFSHFKSYMDVLLGQL